jgi:hypothetical protein
MLKRLIVGMTLQALILATACSARAQQADPIVMQKLEFLSGSWTCTIKGGASNGLVEETHYSFSPDGFWMTETSHVARSNNDWETQMWGYDAHAKKLVAYQFLADGVFTKTVDGWVNGAFVSHRDDNGATVSVKPVAANAMQWVIESADHTYIVKEDCVRR